MKEKKDDTINVNLPASLDDNIAEKIAEAVKDQYYSSVGSMVADQIKAKLEADGFCERVASATVSRMKLDEDEYTEGITNILKEQIINTVGTLASEVLEKVQEKFKSYGFIKIGEKY